MMKMAYRAAVLFAFGLLAGCASNPPYHFLVLDAVGSTQPKAAAHGEPLVIGDIGIPGYLDRPEMVSRLGPHSLDISNTNRWASPLATMIRETLIQDLATRLPEGMLPLAAEADRVGPHRTLAVQIEDFAADSAESVVLKARWSVLQAGSRRVKIRRQETITTSLSGPGAVAQADAMSRAIGTLADHIVTAISGDGRSGK